MATIVQTPDASDEDAREKGDGSSYSSTENNVFFSANVTSDQENWGATRVKSMTIPPGATINSCTIECYVVSAVRDDPDLHLYFEDADDPVDFSSNADVIGRTLTTARTAWSDTSVGTGLETSPDFAAAAQEVIDRPGWASGNAMMVIGVGTNDTNQLFRVAGWDHPSYDPIELTITYTPFVYYPRPRGTDGGMMLLGGGVQ